MMDQRMKQAIATRVLGVGKRLAPDRFPNYLLSDGTINTELVNEWGQELGTKNWPPELWDEAVRVWVREIDHGKMVTSGELMRAGKTVLSRWESDPVKGAQIRAHREHLRDERDRQIKAGTFGALRGYKAIETNDSEPSTVPDTLMELRKNLARRKGVS